VFLLLLFVGVLVLLGSETNAAQFRRMFSMTNSSRLGWLAYCSWDMSSPKGDDEDWESPLLLFGRFIAHERRIILHQVGLVG